MRDVTRLRSDVQYLEILLLLLRTFI